MERLEDKIVELINEKDVIIEGDKAYKYAEFDFKEINGQVTVSFDWHSVEDWQTFDWGPCLVQVEDVIDGVSDIEVECWDDRTGKTVIVDEDYLLDKIDV